MQNVEEMSTTEIKLREIMEKYKNGQELDQMDFLIIAKYKEGLELESKYQLMTIKAMEGLDEEKKAKMLTDFAFMNFHAPSNIFTEDDKLTIDTIYNLYQKDFSDNGFKIRTK